MVERWLVFPAHELFSGSVTAEEARLLLRKRLPGDDDDDGGRAGDFGRRRRVFSIFVFVLAE